MIVRAGALVLLGLVVVSVFGKASASKKKGLCVGPSTHMCNDFKLWHKVNWWYVQQRLLFTLEKRYDLYSKTCLKRPLKKKNLAFKTDYCLMQVKSIAECSKRGSILQYF